MVGVGENGQRLVQAHCGGHATTSSPDGEVEGEDCERFLKLVVLKGKFYHLIKKERTLHI